MNALLIGVYVFVVVACAWFVYELVSIHKREKEILAHIIEQDKKGERVDPRLVR